MVPSSTFTFRARFPASFASLTSEQSHLGDPSTVMKKPGGLVPLLRSAFNEASLVNHLPKELLSEVLMSGAWRDWREFIRLTHICQHWRIVALEMPLLWADCLRSALEFNKSSMRRLPSPQALQEFLLRSGSCPLELVFNPYSIVHRKQLELKVVMEPYLSRLTHLTLRQYTQKETIDALEMVRSCTRCLQSLDIVIFVSDRDCREVSAFAPITPPTPWDDSDLPHLHTVSIPGHFFTPSIAVRSLKTITLRGYVWDQNVILDALEKCALTLEALALHIWAVWGHEIDSPPHRLVQLPRLRSLELYRTMLVPTPLKAILAALSYPPNVTIHVDWDDLIGITRLPIGSESGGYLHPLPSFDSLCLFAHGFKGVASLHGYTDGVECLRVGMESSLASNVKVALDAFRHCCRPAAVTKLAIDFDSAYRPEPQRDLKLRRFVKTFPNLRRLDILGTTVGNTKVEAATGFLDLLRVSSGPTAAGIGMCLAYVCEVPKGKFEKDPVQLAGSFHEQLRQLEALLKDHLEGGGRRLHKLELALIRSRSVNRELFSYYIPPSREHNRHINETLTTPLGLWSELLEPIYLPKFRKLVEHVEFIGDFTNRRRGDRIPCIHSGLGDKV